MSWSAGAGSIRLPVVSGVALEGYVARLARSTHVHDTLLATAMAIAVDGDLAVVAVVDAIAVDRDLCAEVAARAGVDPRRLILCASHTHSGPAGVTSACAPSGADVDLSIREAVIDCCAQAARDALATLAPAELRFSRARSTGVTSNRAIADGPRDRRISALVARRLDGSPIGALLLFACHPTLLGAASTAVSADLPGAVRAALPAFGAPLVVVNGAAADLSTRFTRRTQDTAELTRLGNRLASAARRALRPASSVALEPTLKVACGTVTLPRKHSGPEPEPRDGIKALTNPALRAAAASPSARHLRQAVTQAEGAAREIELISRGTTPPPCELTALQIGSLAVLFASAEVSTTIGCRIEALSPFAETLVVGYAGGYAGYVVDQGLYERQTYEALASPFTPEAGDVLTDVAAGMLRGLAH